MPRVLVMDYSTDRSEGPATARWLPPGTEVHTWVILDHGPVPDVQDFSHVIHTGSALSINDDPPFVQDAMALVRAGVAAGLPQLGICYGHQLLARTLGGRGAVRPNPKGPEAGWRSVDFTPTGQGFFAVPPRCRIFQFHFDEVVGLPSEAVVLAHTEHSGIQAFHDPRRRLVGTQFHPEFDRETGNAIFRTHPYLLSPHGLDASELVRGQPEGFDFAAFLRVFVSDAGLWSGGTRTPG